MARRRTRGSVSGSSELEISQPVQPVQPVQPELPSSKKRKTSNMTTTTTIPPVTNVNGHQSDGVKYPSTDPSMYDDVGSTWELPQDEAGWVNRAKEVASILARDAPQRDHENKSPFGEIALLKKASLTKVLGPTKYGGGNQPWSVAYKCIREVAKVDGSIGMLLGYHLLWSTTANVVGTPEQADRLQELIITNNYFLGGAVNPRDNDLQIIDDGDGISFTGFKHFNTGGVISDLTVLEGTFEDTGKHIFCIVPTRQPGISFAHNWDNIGMRLTESGSVRIEDVKAPWSDALGWDSNTKQPIKDVLEIPFATMLLPTIQLVFSNFYLGIALGALDAAAKYTNTSTRAWPYGGDNKEKPVDEFHVLSTYGNFHAHLAAATTLADRAGDAISGVYSDHPRGKLTARHRGEVAETVASIKVVATDTGLRVTSGVFEVTGSKSTASKAGMDRFWRDIRVHSLHDPVAYKNRELGRYVLLDEVPEPTWYT